MRLFLPLIDFVIPVLIFYINWANSHVAVEIHDGAEDALGQQRIVVKKSRNAPHNFQDQSVDNNEINNDVLDKKTNTAAVASHMDEIHDIQEAKLMIRELQAKLMELDKRIPKKFPEVSFRLLDRKRILVLFNHFKINIQAIF